MPRKDPEARKAYLREYVRRRFREDEDFKQRQLKRVAANNARYRLDAKQVIAEFKSSGCCVCGEDDRSCLDAHHVNPEEKEFSVASYATTGRSGNLIRKELNKCVCVCANCHRKLHAGKFCLLTKLES